MRLRKYLLGIAAIAAIIGAVYAFYGRAVVSLFALANNMDISYGFVATTGMSRFTFDGLTITEKKSGLGLFADKAAVGFSLKGTDIRNVVTDFDLKNVHFLTTSPEKPQSLNNIDGLIAAPFSSHWIYETISGRICSRPDGLRIEKLAARSNELKMSCTGTLQGNSRISSDVTIYFADTLTKKIPPEFSAMVLKDEGGGWKSISVKLDGDYAKPSLQVSGRLFRLTIGLKE